MIAILAEATVTHDRSELYAVIGALVVTCGILWRSNVAKDRIILKLAKVVDERDDEGGD